MALIVEEASFSDSQPLDHRLSSTEMLKAIRVAALNLLARREHGRVELSRKLLRRFGEHQLVEQVLERLSNEKLQSDERFTEAYVYHRVKAGFGPLRIAAELREKGIGSQQASRHIGSAGRDWAVVAKDVRIKKFGIDSIVDLNMRAKQSRFLQYRGFTQEYIDTALESI